MTLVFATALRLFYATDEKITVELHPSNESGASSREIQDIDLYKDEKPFCCIELKDKNFDVSDIRAAFLKVAQKRIKSLLFIVGPNGDFIGDTKFLGDRRVVVCLVGSFVHWEADGLLLAFLVDEGESDVNESHGFNLLVWLGGGEAMRLPFRY